MIIGQSVAVTGVPPRECQQATEPRGLRFIRPAERLKGRSSLGVFFCLLALLLLATGAPMNAAKKTDGPVGLKFIGHSCFVITTPKGARVLIDPFAANEWPGLAFPVVHADHVLVTHPHWDHNAYRRVRGKARPVLSPGEVKGKGFTVVGYAGRHAAIGGDLVDYVNTVYVVETGGVRFCHLGDNGPVEESRHLVESIGPVDVLMIPVDAEQRVLTYAQVTAWIEALSPRVVIPMHYKVPGLSLEHVTGIGTLGEWLSRMPSGIDVTILDDDDVTIGSEGGVPLPAGDGTHEVWVFTLEGQREQEHTPGLAEATDAKARAGEALAAGDTATALAELQTAARALPDDAEIRLKMGFLYLSGGRPDRAVEHFSHGAESAGENDRRSASLCWLGAGMALDLLERRDEALLAYVKVIDLGLNDELQLDHARRYIEEPYEAD